MQFFPSIFFRMSEDTVESWLMAYTTSSTESFVCFYCPSLTDYLHLNISIFFYKNMTPWMQFEVPVFFIVIGKCLSFLYCKCTGQTTFCRHCGQHCSDDTFFKWILLFLHSRISDMAWCLHMCSRGKLNSDYASFMFWFDLLPMTFSGTPVL